MRSSAEIALLFNIAELAKRHGMRPSDADAQLSLVSDDGDPNNGPWHYEIRFPSIRQEVLGPYDRMAKGLGCDDNGILKANELSDLEDIVDRALALAPRKRSL